jgi:hypothetical protein
MTKFDDHLLAVYFMGDPQSKEADLQWTAHLKLGLLFPVITFTNCWKVMAEVEPENCNNKVRKVPTSQAAS